MRARSEALPRRERLESTFGYALTVDVEEWFHTCWVPHYVDPARRPALPEELDRTLPRMLELLASTGRKATFFILGEVAQCHPGRVREIALAGHEVASHGWLHLRAIERGAQELLGDLRKSRLFLEDLIAAPVRGFRAPEWSLRHAANPQLRLVAEAGYRYDASLAPFFGAGRRANPLNPSRFSWPSTGEGGEEEELSLLEFPPLTFGGCLRLPAGSWTGRLASPARIAAAADRRRGKRGLPVLTVHPWELSDASPPDLLSGPARWIQDIGRRGFGERLERLLAARPWNSIEGAMSARPC